MYLYRIQRGEYTHDSTPFLQTHVTPLRPRIGGAKRAILLRYKEEQKKRVLTDGVCLIQCVNVACVALHLVSFRACHQPVSTAAPVQPSVVIGPGLKLLCLIRPSRSASARTREKNAAHPGRPCAYPVHDTMRKPGRRSAQTALAQAHGPKYCVPASAAEATANL